MSFPREFRDESGRSITRAPSSGAMSLIMLPIRAFVYLFAFERPHPDQTWFRANLVRSTWWSVISLVISGILSGGIELNSESNPEAPRAQSAPSAQVSSAEGNSTGAAPNTIEVTVLTQLSLMKPPPLPSTKNFEYSSKYRTPFTDAGFLFVPYNSESGRETTPLTEHNQCALVPHGLAIRLTGNHPIRYVMNMKGGVQYERRSKSFVFFSSHAPWAIKALHTTEWEEVETSWVDLEENWKHLKPNTPIRGTARIYKDVPDARVAGMVCS